MYNIFHVVRDAITGRLKFASKEVQTERRTICDGCEVRDKMLDVCTACGCFLKAKIKLKDAECPMELW